jgi:N-acetylmuramoyl-L-alanine amidase
MNRRGFFRRAALTGAVAFGGLASSRLASAQSARRPQLLAPARRIVAIDAGHGGKDPGAIGVNGTHEKLITMAVARDVARKLESRGQIRVVLTRRDDSFIALEDRVELARAGDSTLFLSLHADAAPNVQARGFSVYTLNENASDEMAALLAKRENAADRFAGVNFGAQPRAVKNILADLMARETATNSTMMAQTVVNRLSPPLQPMTKPHRQANFAVLRAPEFPSVLVEMGFLSNAEDEKLLNQRSYQERLADRLVLSIDSFFASRRG